MKTKLSDRFSKYISSIVILIFIIAFSGYKLSGQIVINEIMSSNSITISDEDNTYPDWIELYNAGSTTINLNGYGLSDTIAFPLKWTFPDIELPPGEYLLAFASGKDKREVSIHWETVIDWGDQWKYTLGTQEPPSSWKDTGFDDSGWSDGVSGFGYGDNDDATVIPTIISFYIRKTFSIGDTSKIKEVLFDVDFDDAFVAYLNGQVIAWENIDYQGTPPPYNQSSLTYTEPLIINGQMPFHYVVDNWRDFLQNGDNVLAIQVHNHGTGSSDLTMIPFLTLGMDSVPDNPRGIQDILKTYVSYLHTNFKIKSEGEAVFLSNFSGQIIDQVDATFIPTDISYGRQGDGTDNWFMFMQSTPGASNNTTPFSGFASEPVFSVTGGFFNFSKNLYLSGVLQDETIYYTIDGSEPDETSTVYLDAVSITDNSIIRARTFKAGCLPSKIVTNSYFFNMNPNLTVISLVSDPDHFFDYNTGIYVEGPNASTDFPYFGANFWQDWERQVNIEIFDINGNPKLNSNAGAKIFGGWSRGNPQKSMSLFARKQYGEGSFKLKLFNDKPLTKFEAFVLRNSGNDWGNTMFRDAMMTGLLKDMHIDRQAYRPSVLYLNNQYWGILNFREKINEHYIASNHPGVDPDSVILLEGNANPIIGDASDYIAMLNYLNTTFDYSVVKTLIDVDNYIDYQLSQIYFNNRDWPGNNIKYWKAATPTGKWRWIIYDTDFGFSIWNSTDYQYNTLAFALDPNQTGWPNPSWSTFLFRRMVSNITFRNEFINRFADMMNSTFLPDKVVNHIDTMQANIEPEIQNHFNRWGGSIANWNGKVYDMRKFATDRPAYMRSYIVSQFGLSGAVTVNLDAEPQNSGYIGVNTIETDETPWSGIYFRDVPITLYPKPAPGYRFVGWTGDYTGTDDTIIVDLDGNSSYIANFIEDQSNLSSVVINEINYNSEVNFNPEDWIELLNISGDDWNLSGWTFKDSEDGHAYIFPDNTIIEKDGFLVVCRDTSLFKNFFPDVVNFIGNFDFGLNADGELIRLYDETDLLIDSVPYDNLYPWPSLPKGNGPTLELINSLYDNSLGENWKDYSEHGTPGKENSYLTTEILSLKSVKLRNYPNPFSDHTNIEFSIDKPGPVKIEIYDLSGRTVFSKQADYSTTGTYKIIWDGCTDAGRKLPQGVYLYKFETMNYSEMKKLILVQ